MGESTKENLQEDLSLNTKSHRHEYFKKENYQVCKYCGKKILNLTNTEKEEVLIGTKSNGSKYSVRTDRRRYFFPDEWISFIKEVEDKEHRFLFLTGLHTGGRIMELLNLQYRNIDEERQIIKFDVVKQRKARKDYPSLGKGRGFFVASEFIKEYKSFIRGKTINKSDYIFLDNKTLPEDYSKLDNNKKKKYYASKVVSYSKILKRKLKKAGIKDWYNFSLQNIRKTYGMWMRTFNIERSELCYRMGNDIDTYMTHYGSSLIFTEDERRKIAKIMGDVK